ncbi:MAG: hypothetical protein HQ592_01440 [Planctomycetes bacterium]|nr:hypothetical protein [Planctomycetota bacterium]
MAWLDGYNYRKKITFSNALVPGPLSNVPMVVKVDEDTDIGAGIEDPVNGYDVRFTEDDGQTPLKYEGPIGWSIVAGEAFAIWILLNITLVSCPRNNLHRSASRRRRRRLSRGNLIPPTFGGLPLPETASGGRQQAHPNVPLQGQSRMVFCESLMSRPTRRRPALFLMPRENARSKTSNPSSACSAAASTWRAPI